MDIEIKKADDNDRTGLRVILQSSFDTLSSLDEIEIDCYIDGQQRPCQWFVARSSQGQVIGCINASTRSNEGYINSLSVIESYRGHGVGSLLVQEACEFLKRMAAILFLSTNSLKKFFTTLENTLFSNTTSRTFLRSSTGNI